MVHSRRGVTPRESGASANPGASGGAEAAPGESLWSLDCPLSWATMTLCI